MFVNEKLIYNDVIKVRKIYNDSFFVAAFSCRLDCESTINHSIFTGVYIYFHNILLLLAQTSYKTKESQHDLLSVFIQNPIPVGKQMLR